MPDSTTTTPLVTIMPKAAEMARAFLAEEEDPSDKFLRLAVSSGGCSGFSYSVSIDIKKDDDLVQSSDGFDIVIDPISADLLKNVKLDYVDTIGHAGFSFENPQATSTCGCGSSFTV